jgi:hypothetical protein
MNDESNIETVMLKSRTPPLITTNAWPIARTPIMHILNVIAPKVAPEKKSLRLMTEIAIKKIHTPSNTNIVGRYSESALLRRLGVLN